MSLAKWMAKAAALGEKYPKTKEALKGITGLGAAGALLAGAGASVYGGVKGAQSLLDDDDEPKKKKGN